MASDPTASLLKSPESNIGGFGIRPISNKPRVEGDMWGGGAEGTASGAFFPTYVYSIDSAYRTRTMGVETSYPLPGNMMGLMERYMPGNVLRRCSTVLDEEGAAFQKLGGQVEK